MTKNKENTNNAQAYREDNPSHNRLFSKESATITSRLKAIHLFLEKKFVVFGTNAEFSEKVHQFAKQIPDVGQTQHEEFVKTRLITCQKWVSDTIKKNNFITPSTKQKESTNSSFQITLKDGDFNKLRSAIRPYECEVLFSAEFTGIPGCFTKDFRMSRSCRCMTQDQT